jgi:hypothetical protein
LNQEHEQQTAITYYAEKHGVEPLKARYNNKVIVGRGMSEILKD